MQLWGAISLIVMALLLIHFVSPLREPPVYFTVPLRLLIIVSASIKQHFLLKPWFLGGSPPPPLLFTEYIFN